MISENETEFLVEEHFHPESAEHFTVLDGKVHLTLDGEEHIIQQGEHFVVPRGVVHKVLSPKGEHTKFKVRGDHDPVAERDFLIQMFTLVETVSAHKFFYGQSVQTNHFQHPEPVWAVEEVYLLLSKREFRSEGHPLSEVVRKDSRLVAWRCFRNLPRLGEGGLEERMITMAA